MHNTCTYFVARRVPRERSNAVRLVRLGSRLRPYASASTRRSVRVRAVAASPAFALARSSRRRPRDALFELDTQRDELRDALFEHSLDAPGFGEILDQDDRADDSPSGTRGPE